VQASPASVTGTSNNEAATRRKKLLRCGVLERWFDVIVGHAAAGAVAEVPSRAAAAAGALWRVAMCNRALQLAADV
jgi:hypothetical protein